jgi:hypothetical protein
MTAAPSRPASLQHQIATAEIIVAPFRRAFGYGELLVKDIPDDQFAHMPTPNLNHPAFNYGHLSLYPNRLFKVIGRPELIVEKPGFTELFQAGSACVEQDGRYPAKDEIVDYWRERYTTAADEISSLPDEAFQQENPLEGRMREIFPTVGVAVNFLLNNHLMVHLGQVSAWRRVIGLGSVM